MKQLQNNFTTPEQSKRLLELGLPADSADMYYSKMSTETFWSLYTIGSGATYTSISTPPYDFMFVPCWSVGRLVEIMLNSQINTGTYALGIMLDKDTFSVESLIDIIDEDIEEFDFSKLEE